MAKYRKKPVEVEAIQITNAWFDGDHPSLLHPVGVVVDPVRRSVRYRTIHGQETEQFAGEWMIRESDGVYWYPCKADVFEATYEPVNSAEQSLVDVIRRIRKQWEEELDVELRAHDEAVRVRSDAMFGVQPTAEVLPPIVGTKGPAATGGMEVDWVPPWPKETDDGFETSG